MTSPARIIPFPAPAEPSSFRGFDRALAETTPVVFGKRDLTMAECRAMADAAQSKQPSNALYSRTSGELAAAIYGIAGPLNRKVR